MRIVLAGAALLAMTMGARGAEVASYPPTAQYLGTCGADTGGFRLPGTEGCLRINGFVAAEAGWAVATPGFSLAHSAAPARADARGSDLSRSSLGTGARLSADLRLPTDLGPVRVFVSLRARNSSATDRAAH